MTCAFPDPLPGGYTFLDVIGNGINGVVVAAVDSVTGEKVALKRFRRGSGTSTPGLQEISNVIGLNHPHVVSCRDCGYDGDGQVYVAYDLVEGGDLRSWLNELDGKPLPPDVVRACAGQMLEALLFLRSQNLVHGDLKPENILVQKREPAHFRLADLGGALRCKGESIRLRQPTGSPAYLAPERFYDSFSFNADLYSLGVILFELTTGMRPFCGSVSDLARAHIAAPADFSKINDEGLRTFIEALLEKNPLVRIRSAADALHIWRLYLESGELRPDLTPATTARSSSFPQNPSWGSRAYEARNRFTVGGHPLQAGFLRSGDENLLVLGFDSHLEVWDATRGSLLSAFLPGRGGDFLIPQESAVYFPDSGGIRRWLPGMRRAERVIDIPRGVRRIAVNPSGEGFAYLNSRSLTVHDHGGRLFHHRLEKQDSTAHITFLDGGELALLEGRLPTTVTILDVDRRVCRQFPLPGAVLQLSPFGEPCGTLVHWENHQAVSHFNLHAAGFSEHRVGNPGGAPLYPVPGGGLFRERDGTLCGISREGKLYPFFGEHPEADLRGLSPCHRYLFSLFKRPDGTCLIEIKQDQPGKAL